jgi:hypothetical protein
MSIMSDLHVLWLSHDVVTMISLSFVANLQSGGARAGCDLRPLADRSALWDS